MIRKKHIDYREFVKLDTKEQEKYMVVKDVDLAIENIEDRKATFIITTSTPDTDNDVIVPEGIDFTHYVKNPVVLWQHNRDLLPIGKCLPESITKTANGWSATVQFPDEGIDAFSDKIYWYVKNGYLSATSIGFIPTDTDLGNNGYIFNKCTIFEFSIVTVPANPEALIIREENKPTKNIKALKIKMLNKLHK